MLGCCARGVRELVAVQHKSLGVQQGRGGGEFEINLPKVERYSRDGHATYSRKLFENS
jgi:hypothetical protein